MIAIVFVAIFAVGKNLFDRFTVISFRETENFEEFWNGKYKYILIRIGSAVKCKQKQ